MSAKKKTAAKGKSTKKPTNPFQLDSLETIGKQTTEIASLMKQLEIANDTNARQKLKLSQQALQITTLTTQLDLKNKDRVDLTSDMARQYKTLQGEYAIKVTGLEEKIAELSRKLAETQESLSLHQIKSTKDIEDRDAIIDDANLKMSYMSGQFEHLLNETLSKMVKKLDVVSQRWKDSEGITLSDTSQKRLADFQLSRCIGEY